MRGSAETVQTRGMIRLWEMAWGKEGSVCCLTLFLGASLAAQTVKNLPIM